MWNLTWKTVRRHPNVQFISGEQMKVVPTHWMKHIFINQICINHQITKENSYLDFKMMMNGQTMSKNHNKISARKHRTFHYKSYSSMNTKEYTPHPYFKFQWKKQNPLQVRRNIHQNKETPNSQILPKSTKLQTSKHEDKRRPGGTYGWAISLESLTEKGQRENWIIWNFSAAYLALQ